MNSGEPIKMSLDSTTPRNVPLTNVTSTSSSLPTTSTPDLEISSFSEEVRDINNQTPSQNLHKSGNDTVFEGQERNSSNQIQSSKSRDSFVTSRLTRTQAELYIANQVEMLQTSEANAHSPEQIDQLIHAILRDNPDLSQ